MPVHQLNVLFPRCRAFLKNLCKLACGLIIKLVFPLQILNVFVHGRLPDERVRLHLPDLCLQQARWTSCILEDVPQGQQVTLPGHRPLLQFLVQLPRYSLVQAEVISKFLHIRINRRPATP